MVYVTGDCHADYHKFNVENFPEQREMTRDDIVIVCGDFGIWHDNNEEQWWHKWLSEKPFTLVFADGNHENFDRLYSDEFEVVDFHGGKAHKIKDNVYHLMRGYVFDFEGKKFFVFGGASSHDVQDGILDKDDYACEEDFYAEAKMKYKRGDMFRINHLSWWRQELPSEEELERGRQSLEACNYEVDYVISHCAPQTVASIISRGFYKHDSLTSYFDELLEKLKFTRWYFGHYHDNRTVMGKFILLYENIERIV